MMSPQGYETLAESQCGGQTEVYDPTIDWKLNVAMPDGSTMAVPQAKLMGGGSSINGGTALRSTTNDSREWVEHGNAAWLYGEVYKAYQALENDQVRGTKGPHPIFRVPDSKLGKIQKAFIAGANAYGHESVLDLNDPNAEGAGPSPVCRIGDTRISAANTFIDPIRSRKNLTIFPNEPVDRIIFSGNLGTGVQLRDRTLSTKEEILCAGAILSPAVLQRSGIGPTNLIKSKGISTVADLPVGHNAYDHPCIPLVAKPKPGAYNKDDYSLQSQVRCSSTLLPGTVDHQLVCFPFLYAEKPDPRVQQRSLAGTTSGHVADIGCNLNKPTSAGIIKIRSRNLEDLPVVDPHYLETDLSRACARELVRMAWKILTSAPMQSVLDAPAGLTQSDVDDDRQKSLGKCADAEAL